MDVSASARNCSLWGFSYNLVRRQESVRHASLDGLSQAALIILQPSGMVYEAQVGGTWCRREVAEGFLVPFDNESPFDSPNLALHVQLHKLLWEMMSLTDELAEAFDRLLSAHINTAGVSVDRSRLGDSCEAWVYVDVRETDNSPLRGFANCKAVLTWPNSA